MLSITFHSGLSMVCSCVFKEFHITLHVVKNENNLTLFNVLFEVINSVCDKNKLFVVISYRMVSKLSLETSI